MANNNALAIRQTLENSGPSAAERQLLIIGREAGDEELAIIVQEFSPGEVGALIGEGDFTKPSIASHFITPSQFTGALERIGAGWGSFGDNRALKEAVSELEGFILSIVLCENEARRLEMLEALLSHDLGHETIIVIALEGNGCIVEFLKEFTPAASEKGTWQELLVEIAIHFGGDFLAVKNQIQSLFDRGESAEIADGLRKHPTERFVIRTLNALVRKARKHAKVEKPKKEKTEEVFVDV